MKNPVSDAVPEELDTTVYPSLPGAKPPVGGVASKANTGAVNAAQDAANYLSSNIGANLKTSNDPQVIKGGAASEAGTAGASALKKRSKAGLSNQLGINV